MFSTRTSMDVGMVHCVPESTCTYVAIYREAMESAENPQEQGGIVHDIITTQVISWPQSIL